MFDGISGLIVFSGLDSGGDVIFGGLDSIPEGEILSEEDEEVEVLESVIPRNGTTGIGTETGVEVELIPPILPTEVTKVGVIRFLFFSALLTPTSYN
jgi:hypothetical protein